MQPSKIPSSVSSVFSYTETGPDFEKTQVFQIVYHIGSLGVLEILSLYGHLTLISNDVKQQ